jgi:hypothetical protein
MAVAFTLLSASTCQLKYRVTSAGAEAGNLDAAGAVTADLRTDCPLNSPMLPYFTAAYALQVNSQAEFFNSSRWDIDMLPRTAIANWIIEADVTGPGGSARLTATAAAADATGTVLTIQFRHTATR